MTFGWLRLSKRAFATYRALVKSKVVAYGGAVLDGSQLAAI